MFIVLFRCCIILLDVVKILTTNFLSRLLYRQCHFRISKKMVVLGRRAQVSFLFSVRQARSIHPWVAGVLLRDLWRAGGFPAGSSAGGEPPRERAGSSEADGAPSQTAPRGIVGRGDSVRHPSYIYPSCNISLFPMFEFLTPFHPSFCLGRTLTFPAQFSFLFGA